MTGNKSSTILNTYNSGIMKVTLKMVTYPIAFALGSRLTRNRTRGTRKAVRSVGHGGALPKLNFFKIIIIN